MRYIMFVCHDDSYLASPNEMKNIDAFNEKIEKAGQRVMAVGIGTNRTAKLVDNRDGLNSVLDKSLFDSEDFYNGFWIVEVASPEEALELALEGSKACNRRVELRPFL